MFEPHSLYIPGKSYIYSLHPFTKLSGVIAIALMVFLGPGEVTKLVVLGLTILFLAVWSNLLLPVLKTGIKLVLPLFIVLILIQGFFYPNNSTQIFSIGNYMFAWEGVVFGLLVTARIMLVLMASLLFLFSTSISTISRALFLSGLPSALSYLLISPIFLLPGFVDRIHNIRESQQSRGLEVEGNILVRIRAIFPLVAPLILGSIMETENMALALETRAFNTTAKRTSLENIPDNRSDKLIRKILLVITIFTVIIGILTRIKLF